MPLYNARSYVRAAIESVLAQTYPNFSLLVVNDGSTDGSETVAAAYQAQGVHLWHQPNQGPGVVMNRALEHAHARGIPFLARIDADDLALPHRLETQIRILLQYPQAAACSANCYYVDPESEAVIGTSTVPTSPSLIKWEITRGLRGLIQGVCTFRTEALYQIGGYRPQYKTAEEVDVFLRLGEAYELRNTDAFLAKLRLNPSSLSVSNVHRNILYQFYALDCARRRRRRQPERDYAAFLRDLPWATRLSIWREETVLRLWRRRMGGGSWPTLLLAALLDPRRVLSRGLRRLEATGRAAAGLSQPPIN